MRSNKTAFTLIELLVLLAVIGILGTLLWPVMARTRARAQRANCANQLHKWGIAFQLYADDYHGWLFTTKHWESTEFTKDVQKVLNRPLQNG
jgi:type II secretory pathway pseudopilin PulG